MGYQTKVQVIRRKESEQWYINFPAALARAMEFSRGEVVEWIVEDKAHLVLRRMNPPGSAMKKKPLADSSKRSSGCSKKAVKVSPKTAFSSEPKDSR